MSTRPVRHSAGRALLLDRTELHHAKGPPGVNRTGLVMQKGSDDHSSSSLDAFLASSFSFCFMYFLKYFGSFSSRRAWYRSSLSISS